MRRWSARWSRCWPAWSGAASRSTGPFCRGFPANSRRTWRGSRRRSSSWRARAFNLGSPKQLGDILFGKMGLAGARKTATGAWSTAAGVLDDLAEQGNRIRAAHSRLAPALQAEIDLHATRCRASSIRRPGASTPLMRWRRRRPGGCRPPSPICRIFRCATRRGARSARPSSRRRATS